MITSRDTAVLDSVAHYYTLTREQITRLHFPEDADGRITRKRLQLLLNEHFINRTRMQVVNPSMGAPAPVYYPSEKGCAWLAHQLEDERYRRVCTDTPNWQHLYHWIQVAETHIVLDQAVKHLGTVTVEDWLSEWSIANRDEERPELRYRLFTLLSHPGEPRLVCAPDAAFLMQKGGHRKVFYLEQDRDTTREAKRVAASKSAGYAALAAKQLHRRHFPATTLDRFTVLMIAPTPKRRDALRQAMSTQPAASVWKFAAWSDLTKENLLTGSVFYPCVGEPASLIVPAEGVSA